MTMVKMDKPNKNAKTPWERMGYRSREDYIDRMCRWTGQSRESAARDVAAQEKEMAEKARTKAKKK